MALHIVSSRAPLPVKKGDQIVLEKRLHAVRDRKDVTVYLVKATDQELVLAEKAFPNISFVRLPRRFDDFLHGLCSSVVFGYPFHYALFWRRSLNLILEGLGTTDKVCFFLERTCCYSLNSRCSYFLEGIDFTHQNLKLRALASNFLLGGVFNIEAQRALRRFTWIVKNFDRISFVSKYDLLDSGVQVPDNLVVCPNGLPELHVRKRISSNSEPTFCFHGNFNYFPNIKVLDELCYIWPKIKERFPNARLTIFGRHLNSGHQIFKYSGVHCLLEVEDVMAVLQAQNFYLCPMNFGTGIQNKLLEAITAGNILVTSDKIMRPLETDQFEYISLNNKDWLRLIDNVLSKKDHRFRDKKNINQVVDKLTWSSSNSAFLSWLEKGS